MGAATTENYDDGGYDSQRERDVARVTHSEPWSHAIGGIAVNNVGAGMLGLERTVYGRSRTILPTGYIALSRMHLQPPVVTYDMVPTDPRHN